MPPAEGARDAAPTWRDYGQVEDALQWRREFLRLDRLSGSTTRSPRYSPLRRNTPPRSSIGSRGQLSWDSCTARWRRWPRDEAARARTIVQSGSSLDHAATSAAVGVLRAKPRQRFTPRCGVKTAAQHSGGPMFTVVPMPGREHSAVLLGSPRRFATASASRYRHLRTRGRRPRGCSPPSPAPESVWVRGQHHATNPGTGCFPRCSQIPGPHRLRLPANSAAGRPGRPDNSVAAHRRAGRAYHARTGLFDTIPFADPRCGCRSTCASSPTSPPVSRSPPDSWRGRTARPGEDTQGRE